MARRKLSKAHPPVEVTVTKEIIDRAEERDSGHCMIADAVKAAIPHARQVSVDLQTIRYSDPEKGVRYFFLTQQIAQAALIDFDQGVHNEEFTFHLRTPVQVKTYGSQTTADGTRKRPSQATQGIEPVNGKKSSPVVLGGPSLPLGPLADPVPNLARVPKKHRATSVNPPGANITLSMGKPAKPGRPRGKKRMFGIKQLRP